MQIQDAIPAETLQEIRTAAVDAELHPESLLRVPLVKRAFTNLNFRLVERGVDSYWSYNKAIPIAISGFNPLQGAYFFGRNSFFSRWIKQPFTSARELNESDILVTEVFFMAHDFLHAWAYQMIDKLRPEAEIFTKEINSANLEEYSFYHLLSEAVATVGLDYWVLSVQDVNSFCDLGSTRGPLTVSYREAYLPEYRRFCPNFYAQDPKFLVQIARFYCTGRFPGFDAADLRSSPRLLSWLKHELKYGVTQRELTRSWLMFLAHEPIELTVPELSSPLILPPAFERLTEELSTALWQLVKENEDPCAEWNTSSVRRQSRVDRTPDFRFLNLNRCEPEQWRRMNFPKQSKTFKYLLFQYLAAIPFAAVPRDRIKYLDLMNRESDPQIAQLLMGDLPRLTAGNAEPRDLFIAN